MSLLSDHAVRRSNPKFRLNQVVAVFHGHKDAPSPQSFTNTFVSQSMLQTFVANLTSGQRDSNDDEDAAWLLPIASGEALFRLDFRSLTPPMAAKVLNLRQLPDGTPWDIHRAYRHHVEMLQARVPDPTRRVSDVHCDRFY